MHEFINSSVPGPSVPPSLEHDEDAANFPLKPEILNLWKLLAEDRILVAPLFKDFTLNEDNTVTVTMLPLAMELMGLELAKVLKEAFMLKHTLSLLGLDARELFRNHRSI